MKKALAISLLFVLFVAFAFSVQAEPGLTIPDSIFEFGYVPQHSTISHVFWLHSTGTDSLKILNVKPG